MPFYNAGTGLSLDDIFDVINVDIENNRVGINNDEPSTDLDVKLIASSNINAFNLLTSNINAYNIQNSNQLITLDLNTLKDVKINGYSLQQPFPNIDWTTIIPGYTGNGYIDPSWIKTQDGDASFGDLSDILALVAVGTAGLAGIASVASFIAAMGASDLAGALAKKLADLLDPPDLPEGDDGEASSNDLKVKWVKIRDKPIATNGNRDIGFQRNMYVSANGLLQVMPPGNFSLTGNNNLQMNPNNLTTLIDYGNRDFFGRSFNTNAITINSNEIRHSNLEGYIRLQNNRIDINSNIFKYDAFNGIIETGKIYCEELIDYYDSNNSIRSSLKFNPNFENRLRYVDKGNPYSSNTSTWIRNDIVQNNQGVEIIRNSNVLWSVDENGNQFATGSIAFSNSPVFLICLQRETAFSNDGRTYQQEGELFFDATTLGFRGVYYDDENPANPPQNKMMLSVDSNGLVIYNRGLIMSSNEIYTSPNPLNLFGSNLTLSNFPRFEFTLSNGMTWGSGYSNAPLNFQNDFFKYTRDGRLYTLDEESYTLNQLTDNFANITKGTTTIFKNGQVNINSWSFKTNGDLFFGNKKIFDNRTKLILGNAVDMSPHNELLEPIYELPVPPINPYLDALSY